MPSSGTRSSIAKSSYCYFCFRSVHSFLCPNRSKNIRLGGLHRQINYIDGVEKKQQKNIMDKIAVYSSESVTVGWRQCRELGAGTADILLGAPPSGLSAVLCRGRRSLRTLNDSTKIAITFKQYDFNTFCHYRRLSKTMV